MPSKNVPSKIAKGEPEVTAPGALATISFFTGVAAACFTVLSLTTFDLSDPGWSSSGSAGELINQGGVVGAYLADISYSLAGVSWRHPACSSVLGLSARQAATYD